MNNLIKGAIAGFGFGIIDILLMIPLPIPNKGIAVVASFINRFTIGFLAINTNLPIPGWAKGVFIGLVLSLPDAIITKSYLPILGVGVVGGLIIGLIAK